MKFVSVRELRSRSADVFRELPEDGAVVITNHGRPVALLSPVTEATLEDTLSTLRRTGALNALASLQREAAQRGADAMTLDQINAEIIAARAGRSR